ncbi:MAG: 50S ribosomal protein L6 [Anaerolineae bacterium]|nr:50S ribosomal protein L6 [Anaerolineae bacterium]
MSRIGKMPINIPAKVTVAVDGQTVTVKGPKGELSQVVSPVIDIAQEDGIINVSRQNEERQSRALHGLTRSLINNMVMGVSTGFQKSLTVEGVGYSGELRGKDLVMKLGYSHEIVVHPPENVSFEVEGKNPTTVRVNGIDKQVVGQVAAEIRRLRPPEPYLGKGVRYSNEVIRRKAGKAGKSK